MYAKLHFKEDGANFVISGPCVSTGETVTITAPKHGVFLWRNGTPIGEALPSLTAEQRGFLMTGEGKGLLAKLREKLDGK